MPSARAPSAAHATCFDYNGPLFPGRGWPWLEPVPMTEVGGAAEAGLADDALCYPGAFELDNRDDEDVSGMYYVSGVPIGPDGCPLDPLDVYRQAIAVDPWLGGSGRELTVDEKASVGQAPDAEDLYADVPPDVAIFDASESNANGQGPSMELLVGLYRTFRWYVFPPLPESVATGSYETPCAVVLPSPSATPVPTPAADTRSYRVTVTGFEEDYLHKSSTSSRSGTALFHYRLAGQFDLRRDTDGRWAFARGRITDADVQVAVSLTPRECWQLKLQKTTKFDEVRGATRLSGFVDSDPYGTDVTLYWGAFRPAVEVPSRVSPGLGCDGSGDWGNVYFVSDQFFTLVNEPYLPLQDHFSKQYSRTDPASRRYVQFIITLDRLP